MSLWSWIRSKVKYSPRPTPRPLPHSVRLILRAFTAIPSALIAEPFEIFLVAVGLLDATALLIRRAQGTDGLYLSLYHGAAGLIAWAGVVGVASLMLVWSLVTMEQRNILAVRRLEISGMLIYAAAFAYYGYANLSVGLSLHLMPAAFLALNEAIILVLVASCTVRALSLSSPITALSVSRVHRVKQIKAQVRRLLDEDGR